MDRTFLCEYKKLNPEQRKAVDTVEGPVMVIAGPGTGKTKVLTLRIANILKKTDTRPENILALTFTESGVYSMRKNLVDIIGSVGYRVNIETFHGFSNRIIQKYPEYFEYIVGSQHIHTPEQLLILEEIVKKEKLAVLKPSGNIYFYVYPLLKKISELKREAVLPAELASLLTDEESTLKRFLKKEKEKRTYIERKKNLEKNKGLLKVYTLYKKVLRDRHLYDYDDMIMETLLAIEKHAELALILQEEYQYILADEHQDANRAQNKLLEHLASFHAPYPNLFIVGDEKQAIFRFQGASLDNFLYFKKLFPKAAVIHLFTNYRSTQAILDAAHSLIEKGSNEKDFNKNKLEAHSGSKGKPISLCELKNSRLEERFVISHIENLIAKGVMPGEIAILYRDNKDAFPLAYLFERTRIPFSIESDEDIFDDEDIQKLLTIVKSVYAFGDDSYFIAPLHLNFFSLEPLDIYKIIRYGKVAKKNIFEIIKSEHLLAKAGVENPGAFTALFEKFSKWKTHSHHTSFLSLVELIAQESGYLEYILSLLEAPQKIQKLKTFYDYVETLQDIRSLYTLSHFMSYLELHERYHLYIRQKNEPFLLNSVRLMTAHRAKGLEFKYVFLVRAQDKHWGGRTSKTYFPITYRGQEEGNSIDDERRLFYVAVTRAREHIYISYAKEGKDGKQLLPSQFIEEIDKKLKQEEDINNFEKKLSIKDELLLKKPTQSKIPITNKEYLNALFLEQGLSVTALNNYISCPWKYFYVNLLRIPHVETHFQMYGTAIHKALEIFFNELRKEKNPSKQFLLEKFTTSLKTFPLQKHITEELLRKGKKSLSGYFNAYRKLWNKNILTEFYIRGVKLSDTIILNGKLDKLEFLDDTGALNVVDYKTGKQKSRKEIEGKTKNGKGDYKRQIVFYKLLLDLLGDSRYRFGSGEIDFVEPNARGNYKKEKFFIHNEEKEKLIETIKKASKEIMDLSFWDKGCNEKDCRYCAFRFSNFQKRDASLER